MSRKALTTIFLTLCTVLLFNTAWADITKQEIAQHYENAVALVERSYIGEDRLSLGSGVFYTSKRLVTNAHVVGELSRDGNSVEIIYTDSDVSRAIYWVKFRGKKYKAHLIGRDPDLDLAILELDHEPPGVMPAEFGDSSTINKGDGVFVFGNPLGFANSVTSGIVSGKQRRIGLLSYEEYIQTDASINPGNSGGALVSKETGKLIGIPNSKIPFSDNMGFAVPINLFRDIKDTLVGTTRHSWIGIQFPGQEFANSEGLDGLSNIRDLTGFNTIRIVQKLQHEIFDKGGVLVTAVMRTNVDKLYAMLTAKGSVHSEEVGDRVPPALKAGFEVGDIIKKFGDNQIKTDADLIRAIFKAKPHEPVFVEVVRYEDKDHAQRTKTTLTVTPIIRNPEGVEEGFY